MVKNRIFSQFNRRSFSSQAVQREVGRIKGLRSLLAALEWSGLSFAQMGRAIADAEARFEPYTKSAVHNWTRRRSHKRYVRLPVEHRGALAGVITEIARERTGCDALVVSVEMNSPLRLRVWVRCAGCGKRVPLDWRRKDWTRCGKCER